MRSPRPLDLWRRTAIPGGHLFKSSDLFRETWKTEIEATARVLDALDDGSLSQAVAPGGRTIGRIAWHIAGSVPEICLKMGLKVEGPEEHSSPPSSAKDIAAAYRKAVASAQRAVADWTDATLEIEEELYGERWKRGYTVWMLIMHEAHHRGQLTVLMRQAGLRVPMIYGPAEQDWATWGMQPPPV